MSSSIQNSSPNHLTIDIPEEYLGNGKTLLIEKYFELFVDGCHLAKPAHFIRRVHDLCLIDTQQQDLRSVNSIHQLQSDIDDNQFVQLIIEFPPESLIIGKSITIEKINSNKEQKPSGNFEDLYNVKSQTKDIHIQIPNQCIQRGITIFIQKEKVFIVKSDNHQKGEGHHLNNNQFTKRDHLQSKNLMEIKIEIPPEYFNDGHTITLKKEDPLAVEANFAYHRQSKSD